MGRYLYANRRHAICLHGTPALGNTYLGDLFNQAPGGYIRPREELIPNGDQFGFWFLNAPNRGSRNDQWPGRFGGEIKATISGVDLRLAGSAASWKADGSPLEDEPKRIPVLRGRDFPAACAQSVLRSNSSDWEWGSRRQSAEYDPFSFTNNCYPLFVEKTPSGWGSEFLAVTLRPVATVPTENDVLSVSPPLFVFTLWRVTASEKQPLDRRIIHGVAIGLGNDEWFAECEVHFRAGLARNADGDSFAVVHGYRGEESLEFRGFEIPSSCVATLMAPYAPPSADACIFGSGLAIIWAGNASQGGSRPNDSMRLKLIDHDHLSRLAFEAGCLGCPDIPGLGLADRTEWKASRFFHQPVTPTIVSCAGLPQDAPTSEGDTTALSPSVALTAGDGEWPTLAYRKPTGLQKITASALATRAFTLDSSGMSEHHGELYATRHATAMTLLGKKFQNAKIEFIGRATGSLAGIVLPEPAEPAIVLDGTQEIDRNFYWQIDNRRAGPYWRPSTAWFPPLGEFDFEPLAISGVQAAQGMLTAPVESSFAETTTVRTQRVLGAGTGFTTPFPSYTDFQSSLRRSAELTGQLFAFFDVIMQEQGQYRLFSSNPFIAPPLQDLDLASYLLPSPSSPNGRIVPVAHHIDGLEPFPLLRMSLFCRTITEISGENKGESIVSNPFTGLQPPTVISISQQNEAGVTGARSLGSFTFSREQTIALMSGQTVAPTTWMNEPSSPQPVKIEIQNSLTTLNFWLEIKGVTLQAETISN